MADEVTVTALLAFLKTPSAERSVGESAKTFDVTGKHAVEGSQTIGTSAEALELGDIGTAGFFWIKNLDGTNFVELLDAVAGNVFMKLKPLEFCLGRFGATAPAGKADTAPCDIEFLIVED